MIKCQVIFIDYTCFVLFCSEYNILKPLRIIHYGRYFLLTKEYFNHLFYKILEDQIFEINSKNKLDKLDGCSQFLYKCKKQQSCAERELRIKVKTL